MHAVQRPDGFLLALTDGNVYMYRYIYREREGNDFSFYLFERGERRPFIIRKSGIYCEGWRGGYIDGVTLDSPDQNLEPCFTRYEDGRKREFEI